MLDPHSIEIMTDEGPLALQIQETVSVNFENMKPGVNVTFQYYTLEQGQNILEQNRGKQLKPGSFPL